MSENTFVRVRPLAHGRDAKLKVRSAWAVEWPISGGKHHARDESRLVDWEDFRELSYAALEAARAEVGLAAREVWPCDVGPDPSRGSRALKVWFAFQTFGADMTGQCIEQSCHLARHLAERLSADGAFELCAPVVLNIECFSVKETSPGGPTSSWWKNCTSVEWRRRPLPCLTVGPSFGPRS